MALALFFFVPEYHELAHQIVDDNQDHIGNDLNHHVVHVQHIYEQPHTEQINQLRADTEGKEGDDLFPYGFRSKGFTMKHPFPMIDGRIKLF